MKMKFILLLLSFFVFPKLILAQENERLQLEKIVQSATNDSVKFDALRDLGYSYEDVDSSNALKYYRQAHTLALKLNNDVMLSKVHTDYGNVYRNASLYQRAKLNHSLALQYAQKAGDSVRIAVSYANIGNVFNLNNKKDSSVQYQLKALRIFESLNDSTRLLQITSNISGIYYDNHQYENSIAFSKRTIDIGTKVGYLDDVPAAYINIASSYFSLGNKDSSEVYLLKARELAPEVENLYKKALAYQNLSSHLSQLEKFESADVYADTCVVLARQLMQPNTLVSCLMMKSVVLNHLKEYKSALPVIDEALELALMDKEWFALRELYRAKSIAMYGLGDFKSAYELYDKYQIYRDSSYNKEMADVIAGYHASYEFEKKEQELKLAKQENELDALRLKQQSRLKWFFAGIALLLACGGVLLYFNFRKINIIHEQHETLQQQRIRELENERQMVAMDAIIRGEENERRRVAKDLHDGVGSLLSGIKLSLSSMKGNVVINDEHARVFSTALGRLDEAIREMRRVAHNMMPEALLKFGLVQAVRNFCDGLNESGSPHVHFEHHGFNKRLSSDNEITVYRIIQELMNNAVKYAKASDIIVQLSIHDGNVQLVVEDDGVGFDVEKLGETDAQGYANLRHRVNYLKGTLDVRSREGQGTSVLIEFPLH